ncbi:MAG: low specificity L-threonine aldolase [Acidaminococcaceae bacterium]
MKIIDLRSDTLTLPTQPMLATIFTAELGDDGRLDANGRGEDKTINKLEDMAAALTGKEAGLFCCSGTLGNQAALFTYCRPHDLVLVDELQHLYGSEKTAFDSRFGQMQPLFYKFDAGFMPDLADLEDKLKNNRVSLLCLENSHNFTGGTCVTLDRLAAIRKLADKYQVPIHMDGARLFNAAAYLKVSAKEICKYVDSVMFCVSKGLGAPVGSLLCGPKAFIDKAKENRKLLGGALRQGGIAAAPAIYALEHNIERLAEDNANAALCVSLLTNLKKIKVQASVQTNIVMLDLSEAGITPVAFCAKAKEQGLLIRPILKTSVRLVFYNAITADEAREAANIIKKLDKEL